MFKDVTLYSAWDEQGLPTKDKDGNDITKSMTKKLKKQWEQQKKLHEEYFGEDKQDTRGFVMCATIQKYVYMYIPSFFTLKQ